MLMQHSGMSAKGEPRNVVNGLIPRPLLREYTQEDRVHRVLQGAVPDVAYTDPGHGKEMIVELKFINAGPTRYDREVATSLRAAVHKREQQLIEIQFIKFSLETFNLG